MGVRSLLALIVLCGLTFRIAGLNSPVDYDEAYTVVEYASRSWWTIISDYSLPNNHIFHSLLVRASLSLFGMHAWSIRLPTLLAGLGIIIAVYILGRALYSPETGLVTAALAAFLPEVIRYSISARGYSLVGLFTLLLFWLANQAVHKPHWRIWVLMSLTSALGLWTIPVMFYPAGAAYLWIVLEGPHNWKFISRWLASGLGTGVLSLVFYSPALYFSGIRRVFANGFVQPVEAGKYFDWLLIARLRETLAAWTSNIPWGLVIILAVGFLLSLLLHPKIGNSHWPLAVVVLAWCTFLVLTRRPEVFDRFWSWLVAPMLVWCAGGLVETSRTGKRIFRIFPKIIVGVSILGLVTSTIINLPGIAPAWNKTGNPQAAAQFVEKQMSTGDSILVGYPNNASLWYYLMELNTPRNAWQADKNANRYLVLLASNQKDQTLTSIFKAYKLDPNKVDIKNAKLIGEYGKIKIYTCTPMQ